MFKNYFKTAIRNLMRNKVFSFINITGLSIGLACCILILLFTKDELSYDRFHARSNQIYQLTCDRIEKEGTHKKFAIAAMVQGPAFKQEIPEIQAFVRVDNKQLVIKKDNTAFSEKITWADDNFFSIFSFPLLAGNPLKVLADLHSVVLTDEMADKYFGTRDVIGKTLQIEINGAFEPFTITGVAQKSPENSSIKFSMVLPFKYLEQINPDNGWMWVSYPTYFVINRGADVNLIKTKMAQVFQTQAKSEIDINHQAGYDNKFVWGLLPFQNMHLNTEYEGVPEASSPVYSYILTGITVFILLIACINFVNLSMAQFLKRSKEIGIRKAVGGLRRQLIKQFLGESFLVCLISFSLAILLAVLLLPVFNQLANKKLSFVYLFDFQFIAVMLVLFVVTVFAAGFYPAIVLSGFKPVKALQSSSEYGGKNYLSKSLIVAQFSLATFLVIATLFIYAQFNYLTKTNLGYNDKNLVEFVVEKAVMDKPLMNVFKTAFTAIPGVETVSYKNVGKFGGKTQANGKEFVATYEHVDENYLTALQVPVLAGRNFSANFSDSLNSVLVNETFAKEAGWKDPVGKTIDFMNLPGWGNRKVTVIGLVKDYHFESLREKIKPLVLTMEPQLPLGNFLVRVNQANIQSTILAMEKKYHALIPDDPFQYYFKSDLLNKNYQSESQWKAIVSFAALVTIFISCIGLFGLTMLSTEKRYKEMGIRKALGATTVQVVELISRDFIKLVFIAFLIAIPIGWYTVSKWLQNFAYHINISWWMFAIAGLLALLIAFFTVSFHSIKASLANPVNSLRTE